MIRQRIGVVLEALRLRAKEGIKTASMLGFNGIQINVTQGELTPENLSQTGCRELKRIVNTNRLVICALGGELGAGFINENDFVFLIEKTKKLVNLALELQTNIITIQIGNIPLELNSSYGDSVITALTEVGTYAEHYGCNLAANVNFDNYDTLKGLFAALQTQGIKLNYSPAALLTNNLGPVDGILGLHEYIAHTNLWDTRQIGEGRRVEVPIGEGILPMDEIITTLESTGYQGHYVINSNITQDAIEDIKKSKDFLDRF